MMHVFLRLICCVRAGSNGSLGARPVRADKPPARVASKPYFDYSQPTTSDGASAPPPVPNHILEVFNISPSVKLDEPGDAFADIKVRDGCAYTSWLTSSNRVQAVR